MAIVKFRCRFCNKGFQDMLGAVGCSCKKNVIWNNPCASKRNIVPIKWKGNIK